jgi:D-sedoheptulose 7-phosphate isomerase
MERAVMDMIEEHFQQSSQALGLAARTPDFMDAIRASTQACVKCLRDGGKLLIAGNGGSAGDAQHIAGEFLSRLNFDRAPLAAVALTTDTSVLTAIGNDYGYEHVFERQVRGLARPRDVFIAISTSGRSPNILRALAAGREMGTVNIGVGAAAGEMRRDCDIYIGVPSTSTPMIQQIYMVAAHALCGTVEQALFGGAAR